MFRISSLLQHIPLKCPEKYNSENILLDDNRINVQNKTDVSSTSSSS